MNIYRQRDIALVPFPFSDLSQQKVRPVLILSNDLFDQVVAEIHRLLHSSPQRPDHS